MLRRASKIQKLSVCTDSEESQLISESANFIQKNAFNSKDRDLELEKVVFGTEEEALSELNHFIPAIKRKKSNHRVVERVAKWQDDNDLTDTKLQTQPRWAISKPSENSDDESDNDLARTTGDYLASSFDLSSDKLDVKKCTDANKEQPSRGKIKSVEFLERAQLMLTASMDSKLCFFQVDGKFNPKIESIGFESFPIFKAHFTKDGEQVILGSWHKSFKIFDINSMKISHVCIKGLEHAPNTKNFVISPDGRHMCLVGQYGYLHLLSVRTRELVHTFHMNGPAEAVCFSSNGETMLSHGDDGEVFIWDIKSRTCRHKFIDEGCTKGTGVCVSSGDLYVATGSYSGVVNIYDESCFEVRSPKPLKAIMNLTSSCTSLTFNSTAEILAISSNFADSALKLVHVPTQTVFSNFPKKTSSLHIPISLDFSPNSGYLTIGNNKGKALLYRIRHYSSY